MLTFRAEEIAERLLSGESWASLTEERWAAAAELDELAEEPDLSSSEREELIREAEHLRRSSYWGSKLA